METTANSTKSGRFRRGWELTKSSWRVLTLDKELMAIPVIGFFVGLIAAALLLILSFTLILVIVTYAGNFLGIAHQGSSFSAHGVAGSIPIIVIGVLLYVLLTLISNYFSGAIIYGANERFNGGDPTVRSSLAGAGRKLGPLTRFSVIAGSVGMAMQILRDRLPFIGDMLVNLGGLAWSIATVFAVPVIVLSDEKVGPIKATKKSMGIVRKIWGEGLISQAGVALITLLGFFSYSLLVVVAGVIIALLHVPHIVAGSLIGVGILGLLAMLVIFNTLGAIAKAAMYHYATTGEAPEAFNKELLHAALTVKKARRIFA